MFIKGICIKYIKNNNIELKNGIASINIDKLDNIDKLV